MVVDQRGKLPVPVLSLHYPWTYIMTKVLNHKVEFDNVTHYSYI